MTEETDIAELIRKLRHRLNLSQESFSARLGVSFRSVNRWENGHSLPSPMALNLIREMLQQVGATHELQVIEKHLRKINESVKS